MQPPTSPHAPRKGARRHVLLGVCALAVALAGCSSHPARHQTVAPVAAFDDHGSNPQTCMAHQTRQPTPAYQAGSTAVSALELPMLAYYTANGDKPYCDRKPPTPTDTTWLRLYVHDGGQPAHVTRNLG